MLPSASLLIVARRFSDASAWAMCPCRHVVIAVDVRVRQNRSVKPTLLVLLPAAVELHHTAPRQEERGSANVARGRVLKAKG